VSVIREPVVRAPIGGEDVWCEQSRYLLEYSELPGLPFQILPLNRTARAGLNGPFVLLETPEHQRLAYAETQRGSQLVADPNEVGIRTQKCAMPRSLALAPEDTRDMLDRLPGEQ
jgi:hypothetical protein